MQHLTLTALKRLPKGEYFTRKDTSKKTYIKGDYCRTTKKWSCINLDDHCDELFIKSGQLVFTDYEIIRKPVKKLVTGYILYRGASLLDGKPIVVVAITKRSSNVKTGNVVQTYILADNGQSPLENIKSLGDESICGSCIHRRGLGGACYVNIGQGVTMVFKSLIAGNYPVYDPSVNDPVSGKMVRLGTYGDPASVPRYVWDLLLTNASGHLGYTHQWKNGQADHVMDLCMASADNVADRIQAKLLKYRTFRVRSASEPVLKGEFQCPASAEQGKRLTCVECKACSGGVNTAKADPVIIVHGSLKSRFVPMLSVA